MNGFQKKITRGMFCLQSSHESYVERLPPTRTSRSQPRLAAVRSFSARPRSRALAARRSLHVRTPLCMIGHRVGRGRTGRHVSRRHRARPNDPAVPSSIVSGSERSGAAPGLRETPLGHWPGGRASTSRHPWATARARSPSPIEQSKLAHPRRLEAMSASRWSPAADSIP